MNPNSQQLGSFSNPEFNRGASLIKQALWYCFSWAFVNSSLPFSGFKKFVLRLFGAKIEKGVLIKPNVNIKYPWKLTIGENSWIGENVWIDNLDQVTIGKNVCVSQGAMLLCGNHNFKKSSFDLFTAPIILEDGSWVCAQATVGPGITCGADSILSPMSFASHNLENCFIYSGVPATKKSKRFLN